AIFCIAVLAPDQRDVVAELLAVEVEEAVTVAVLLLPHSGEHARRSGIALAHRLREVAIGAAVLLLESDGEGQQFLLRQVREVLHRRLGVVSYSSYSTVGRSWASAASDRLRGNHARSNRSRFITLFQAATKSRTNAA